MRKRSRKPTRKLDPRRTTMDAIACFPGGLLGYALQEPIVKIHSPIESFNRLPLILAVRPDVIPVVGHARHTVRGHAGRVGVNAVGSAGAHAGHYGDSRPHRGRNFFERIEYFFSRRWRYIAVAVRTVIQQLVVVLAELYFDFRICNCFLQRESRFLQRMAREDTAIHVSLRALGQGVVCVTSIEPRGYAGGTPA